MQDGAPPNEAQGSIFASIHAGELAFFEKLREEERKLEAALRAEQGQVGLSDLFSAVDKKEAAAVEAEKVVAAAVEDKKRQEAMRRSGRRVPPPIITVQGE